MNGSTRTARRRSADRTILVQLGERVRKERHGKGMTQIDLARVLDVSVAYVSLIERGCRNPPYTTVVAIARALGVATPQMFGGS